MVRFVVFNNEYGKARRIVQKTKVWKARIITGSKEHGGVHINDVQNN